MTQTAAVAAAPRMDARRARPGAESRASEAGSEPHAAGPPSLVCRLNSPRATARPCRPVVDANTVGRPPFPAPTSCGSSPSSPRKYKRRRSCQRRRFSRARHPPAHPPARPPPPHDAAGCVTETEGTRCAEGGDRAAPRAPARLRLPGRAPQASIKRYAQNSTYVQYRPEPRIGCTGLYTRDRPYEQRTGRPWVVEYRGGPTQ